MSINMISIMDGFEANGSYQRVSGIIKGNQDKTIQYLKRIAATIERLSDKILYAPNVISVQDITQSSQRYVDDLREVRAFLEPVQRAIKDEILSSAMIVTPEKMQNVLAKNPWEVLIDVRPANLATHSAHTDMMQVLFNHNGTPFIGWQMREVLPQLFDCQYEEFWQPSSNLRSSSIICGNQFSEKLPRLPTQIVCALQGHSDWVNSVAFSPDGRTLASGGEDKMIKLWQVSTAKEIRTLKRGWLQKAHEAPVRTVAFSPDGRILASGSDDNTIKLWEISSGKVRRTLQGEGLGIRTVAFSPDGHTLASENDNVKLWEVSTGNALRTFNGLNAVAFSPNGRALAAGAANNTIKLWEVSTGKEVCTLKRHLNDVASIAFSPDGCILASGSEDKTIKFWDLKTGKAIGTLLGHEQSVCSIAFRPDGRILASASADKTIKLWEFGNNSEFCTLQGHDCMVNSIAFSPDGSTLATASSDKSIKLWQ